MSDRKSSHARKNKYPSKAPHPLALKPEIDEAHQQFAKVLDEFNLKSNTPFDANLFTILMWLSEGIRLNRVLRTWLLLNTANKSINSSVLRAFHTVEAKHQLNKFNESFDPLRLISAADHYNEAGSPELAIELLKEHDHIKDVKNKKVAAFYCLSFATSLHALRRFEDAKLMALAAYQASKEEIATCNLLASIHLHLGQRQEAIAWYEKSHKNGCSLFECDEHMRSSLKTVSLSILHEVVKGLIISDPHRYKSLRSLLPKKMRGAA